MRKRLETVAVPAVHAPKCASGVVPVWSGNLAWAGKGLLSVGVEDVGMARTPYRIELS